MKTSTAIGDKKSQRHRRLARMVLPAAIFAMLCFAANQVVCAGSDADDPVSFDRTVIEGRYIRALVPAEEAAALRERVRRLDEIFDFMCAEAGWTPKKKLVVNIVDEYDYLAGWATFLPRPLVELGLCPGAEGSYFMAGERRLELVAIHEFAHILNMEPNFGFRAFLERVFGRVIPGDPLSLLVAYLSLPPQATMPAFWLEGAAQWAETKYSPPDSIWGGRGRDPSIHMIWRLDTAAGKIPNKGDWRPSHIHWPFGSRPYNYGLAYTRYLEGAYGDRVSIWDMTLDQARYWPFIFNRGAGKSLGKRHGVLINEALDALEKEQKGNIGILKSVPPTPVKRLTPADHIFGAPAWTDDGRLFVAAYRPYADSQRYVFVDSEGRMRETSLRSYDVTAVRRSPGGSFVTGNFKRTVKGRYRSRISIVKPNSRTRHLGLRLVHPDLAEGVFPDADALAALRFTGGGKHELRIYKLTERSLEHTATVPAKGLPWSPAFRPRPGGSAQEIAWVETGERTSRLVIAPLSDLGKRRVLLDIKGRITHPVWDCGGRELFYCSDVTGVSNAYRLTVSNKGAALKSSPVTHTIGGVVACVPSPDGKELAIIDHDAGGPFVARIPNNPNRDCKELPKIDIAWPAPVNPGTAKSPALFARSDLQLADAGRALRQGDLALRRDFAFQVPPKRKSPAGLAEYPYSGLGNLEFRYWTPTTAATRAGGYGVQAAFGDPLGEHDVKAGAGIGGVEYEPVGQMYYGFYGWPRIDIMAMGYALESTWNGRVEDTRGNHYDHTETVRGGSVSLGFDLSGIERDLIAVAGFGYHDYEAVEDSVGNYANRIVVTPPAFEGSENFAQFGLFYNDTTFYPTSYHREDGLFASLAYRHSGRFLGGDLDRNRALAKAGYVFSVLPRLGHQIEVTSATGWSDGGNWLQGAFTIGGMNRDGIHTPRGYPETEATGRYLGAYAAAYRFPVYRPFRGFGTTPFEIRQIVLDFFYGAALISQDNPFGDGDWFRSAGVEATLDMRFFNIPLRPGIQVARQLDGDEDSSVSVVLRGLFQ